MRSRPGGISSAHNSSSFSALQTYTPTILHQRRAPVRRAPDPVEQLSSAHHRLDLQTVPAVAHLPTAAAQANARWRALQRPARPVPQPFPAPPWRHGALSAPAANRCAFGPPCAPLCAANTPHHPALQLSPQTRMGARHLRLALHAVFTHRTKKLSQLACLGRPKKFFRRPNCRSWANSGRHRNAAPPPSPFSE